MDWLAVLGPSILAVMGAAAFTLLFSVRTEHQRRRGIHALATQELWHNQVKLRTLRAALETTLQYDDARLSAADFRATASSPRWYRTRWVLPDVGVAFSREELTRLSEWYVGLDGLTFLYDRLMRQVLQLTAFTPEQGTGAAEQISGKHDRPSGCRSRPYRRERLAAVLVAYSKPQEDETGVQ